ncbi:MAG TPA: LysM domain-containing protein [Gaiellaceae bacterium]
MEPRTRRELTRYGAPAAFLAAVTIAVLLVKSGLDSGPTKTPTSGGRPARTTTAAPRTTTRLVLTNVSTTSATSTTTTTPGAEYYVIQAGDTLGSIAQKYGTTTDALAALNPGVDPTALRVGQKLRVR